jgi:hypothetical protein
MNHIILIFPHHPTLRCNSTERAVHDRCILVYFIRHCLHEITRFTAVFAAARHWTVSSLFLVYSLKDFSAWDYCVKLAVRRTLF